MQLGNAIETLPLRVSANGDRFDLIFIDAEIASIPDNFTRSLKLSRPGTAIIVDNVVRKGAVIESNGDDAAVQDTRKFYEMLATEKRLNSAVIQTVGNKGYDGFTIAAVKG